MLAINIPTRHTTLHKGCRVAQAQQAQRGTAGCNQVHTPGRQVCTARHWSRLATHPHPPSNGKAWYRLALAHQALQHHQAAHVAAQHAAHLMPNNTVHSLVQQLELAMPHPPTHLPACPVTPALFPAPLTGTYVPDARGSNYNLLILLHGLGDTHVPFAQLARRMELPDTAAVALGGVEEVEETGGRAWFAVEWVDDDEGGSTIQVDACLDGGCVCMCALCVKVQDIEMCYWCCVAAS